MASTSHWTATQLNLPFHYHKKHWRRLWEALVKMVKLQAVVKVVAVEQMAETHSNNRK
jgi:hypothetical protein